MLTTIENYRVLVRQAPCPFCEAQPGEPCVKWYPPPPGPAICTAPIPLEYVHDDRSAVYHFNFIFSRR
jgi:hypothetical protein